MKNLFYFLLLIGMTAIISCKGEQGDPGPAGVMGQDGIDGTNGTNGTNGQNGQNGQDGNANITSYTTTVQASNWIWAGSDLRYVGVSVPTITQAIYDNGLIMVYSHNIGSSGWLAWPLSYAYGGGTRSFFYFAHPGTLELQSSSSTNDPFEGGIEVRIVTATADGLARNPNLDWTNYEAVAAAMASENPTF